MSYICYTVATQPEGYEFSREAYHFPSFEEAEVRYESRLAEVEKEVEDCGIPVVVTLYEQHTLFGTLIPRLQQVVM